MADDFLRQLEAATTPAAKAALLAEFAVSNQIPALLPSLPALALLRWFTSPIVGAVLAEEKPEAVESLFQQVIGLPFVERVTFGYAIHDLTREGILERGESLPQAVLARAAAAYAQMEDRHSLLEALYCWTLAQRQKDALALWEQELLTAARMEDWSHTLVLFNTVDEAEKIYGAPVIAYSAFHFMIRGIALAGLGDPAGAVADYNVAIRLNPQYAAAYINRGGARRVSGDVAGAIADYNVAIRLNPQYADAYYNRGNAREDAGDMAGAIADYDEAIRLNPQYAAAYINRGGARRVLGDVAGAIADYDEAIRLNPQDAKVYNNRGTAREDEGDVAGAIADYDEAIRLDPQLADVYYNRGGARYNAGDVAGAIADYDETIRLNPQDAPAYGNRGVARRASGDLAGAIADYDEAIRLNPQYAAAYINRGGERRASGDLERAIVDYDEAIRLNPQDADAYSNRGTTYRQQGQIAQALADHRRAVELDPNRYLDWAALADLARRQGDEDSWRAAIERARPLLDETDLYNAACFYSVAGEVDRAFAFLTQALAQNPGMKPWAQLDPDLDWIREDPRFAALVADP